MRLFSDDFLFFLSFFFFFFFLGGGVILISWNVVCRGLGISNILNRNKALVMKWLWRFPMEQDTLWHKVIRSKYGINQNGWDTREATRVTYRSPWKFISSCYDDFFKYVQFEVGNGVIIRFWEDVWMGDFCSSRSFPALQNGGFPQCFYLNLKS